MTNGDAIKAMFPDVEVKEKNNGYEVYFGIGTAIQFFNHQWWNAPYKENIGEFSDGYHTFNQLYHQRAVLFACIVRQNKNKTWKSFKHSDGKYCFDSNGEWFIVGVDTPQGSYTYHYAKEYWDMFDCQELECGKEWDGHTEEDVNRLLSLEQQHCEDAISRESVIEWLKDKDIIKTKNQEENARRELATLSSVTPSYNSIKTELKPYGDCISRQALIEKATSWDKHFGDSERCVSLTDIQNAPSVTPKQLFINKPCISEGVCREDKINVLKKIRVEIIELRTRQNVGVLECLDIIDEYIAESED